MTNGTSFAAAVPVAPPLHERFADLNPPLSSAAAVAEAHRCLNCFDAPCTAACPTHIDVPGFIKKIASGNMAGSARTILDANILGASCSRACPVSVLCEGACVMHGLGEKPIAIGHLQRHAMEPLQRGEMPLPFKPAAPTGKRVALIGAGPASLACAAELRRAGVEAHIFDARALPGGLNTYGIAEYKLPLAASLREIDLVRSLGVEFHQNVQVDAAMLAQLEGEYHAVFLGVGLGAIHALGIGEEGHSGVTDALTLIESYKAEGYKNGAVLSVPARVAVIGAGNTAIDAAIAAVRLGADRVTMVYRRGPEQMSAFDFEYAHAKEEGVQFLFHAQPTSLTEQDGAFTLCCDATNGEAQPPALPVDLVVLSIGQGTHTEFLGDTVATEKGRVLIDRATGRTSNPKFFAGGDCVNGGREVVDAVADGKRAGVAMVSMLQEAARADA